MRADPESAMPGESGASTDAGGTSHAGAATDAAEGGVAWHPICGSDRLRDAGEGVRFALADGSAAFAVRVAGQVRAYLNRCPHIGVELDAWPGQFFDDDGLHLLCSVHGARFDARDGRCESGPCPGRHLQPVDCREHEARIWVRGVQ